LNGSLVITNNSAVSNEDIEMQLMNSNSLTPLTPPTWETRHMPPDCCPSIISKYFSCCTKFIPKHIQQRWTFLRGKAHRLVEHQFFEWLIIGSILASSATLVSC
jgi:hypothetical protein